MRNKIAVGSRGSRLAMIQTHSVLGALTELNPSVEATVQKIATAGDLNRRTKLEKMGAAAFVKELELALLDRRIDFAVHSLKDVPTDLPEGLCLLVVPERLDPRDVLIADTAFDALAPGSRIGTGSLRRTIQIKNLRQDWKYAHQR
jgi:hydroxymethylbilane synthase